MSDSIKCIECGRLLSFGALYCRHCQYYEYRLSREPDLKAVEAASRKREDEKLRRKKEAERAEAERRKQAARIKKNIIGFIAILLLIFFIPPLAPLRTSIVNSENFKTITVFIQFGSSYFKMALVPVIGEILFALSTCVVFLFSLAKIIGLIFGVGTSVFPYLEMFLIALSTGLACLIRWLCIMAYFKLFD